MSFEYKSMLGGTEKDIGYIGEYKSALGDLEGEVKKSNKHKEKKKGKNVEKKLLFQRID